MRDRDSDNEDWEQKENSRTHSVKFTEDAPELKEVRFCCCMFFNHSKNRRSSNATIRFHDVGKTCKDRWSKVAFWLRTNICDTCSRHRAYLALGTLFATLDWNNLRKSFSLSNIHATFYVSYWVKKSQSLHKILEKGQQNYWFFVLYFDTFDTIVKYSMMITPSKYPFVRYIKQIITL